MGRRAWHAPCVYVCVRAHPSVRTGGGRERVHKLVLESTRRVQTMRELSCGCSALALSLQMLLHEARTAGEPCMCTNTRNHTRMHARTHCHRAHITVHVRLNLWSAVVCLAVLQGPAPHLLPVVCSAVLQGPAPHLLPVVCSAVLQGPAPHLSGRRALRWAGAWGGPPR